MEIFLNKIHYPVKNLGPGVRLGIWLQGCDIRCRGCIDPGAWEFSDEKKLDMNEAKKMIGGFAGRPLDGITISGGEPFAQPEALEELVSYCGEITIGDILVYSGHSYAKLKKDFPGILKKIDVIISEPFVEAETDELIWRGSDNQKVWLLSDKAKDIYPENINEMKYTARNIQIANDGGRVFIIGIPARNDLERISGLLEKRGMNIERL